MIFIKNKKGVEAEASTPDIFIQYRRLDYLTRPSRQA